MSDTNLEVPDESGAENGGAEGGEVLDAAPGSHWPVLSFNETRVLGCLLEKEATTPAQYPLTENALHSACNQSSNRDPVVDLGTDEVEEAVEGLRYKDLALLVHQAGARVPKCKHTLDHVFPYLTKSQTALLCVLLLRGQQTAGELRQRTERLHPFVDVAAAEKALDELVNYEPAPVVKRFPAGGGRRVATYVHLLSGDVADDSPSPDGGGVAISPPVSSVSGWREELEGEVARLRAELAALREEVEQLKSNLGI